MNRSGGGNEISHTECQLWQEGSKPKQIQNEEMLLQLTRIHENPVKRGCVGRLTKLANKKRGPFVWVLITVDEVREEAGMICLTGRAERFSNKFGFPELKPLR